MSHNTRSSKSMRRAPSSSNYARYRSPKNKDVDAPYLPRNAKSRVLSEDDAIEKLKKPIAAYNRSITKLNDVFKEDSVTESNGLELSNLQETTFHGVTLLRSKFRFNNEIRGSFRIFDVLINAERDLGGTSKAFQKIKKTVEGDCKKLDPEIKKRVEEIHRGKLTSRQ